MNDDKIPKSAKINFYGEIEVNLEELFKKKAVQDFFRQRLALHCTRRRVPPAIDFHQEAEDLFLRLDRIYAAVDSVDEIEKTLRRIVNASHHC